MFDFLTLEIPMRVIPPNMFIELCFWWMQWIDYSTFKLKEYLINK